MNPTASRSRVVIWVLAVVLGAVSIAIIGITISALNSDGWSRATVSRSQSHGNEVVEALNRYRQTHSQYPRDLSDLVPQFLSDVPQPVTGYPKWRYESTTDHFTLEFSANRRRYPRSWITSDNPGWWYIDA